MDGGGYQEEAVKKPRFKDVADGPEHERIAIIGRHAMAGQVVGFFVDDDAKADRYIEKLLRNHPQLEVTFRGRWAQANDAVLVKVALKKVVDTTH